MDPQILGDGLTFTTATRHQHRLVPVTESSISGGLEQVFQLPLFLCRESDPLHFVHSPLMRNCSRGYLKKDARSAAACIRNLSSDMAEVVGIVAIIEGKTEGFA